MISTINHRPTNLPFVVVLKHYVKAIILSPFSLNFSNILEKQVRAGDFYHVIGRVCKKFPRAGDLPPAAGELEPLTVR